MGFTCKDASDYLDGPTCRRIARDETRSVSWIDAEDILQEARANLFQYRLARTCPAPDACPLNGGRTANPCDLGEPGPGKAYVKAIVRRMAFRRRRARSRETPGEQLDQLAGPHQPVAGTDPGLYDELDEVEFRQFAPKLLEQYLAMRKRVSDGESPRLVFPGIGRARQAVKLAAAQMILMLEVEDAADALRQLDPGYFGDPHEAASRGNTTYQRVTRDRDCVMAICSAVWRAAMGREA